MDESPIEPIREVNAIPAEAKREDAVANAAPRSSAHTFASMFALAAWAVPGLGHLLLRRWIKAAAFFIAVAGLALLGYTMRGDVFPFGSDGPFGTMGFLADVGSGAFYLLSRVFEAAGADLSHSSGDYGTRLIAAAGILNVLAVIDAYETAVRRRM